VIHGEPVFAGGCGAGDRVALGLGCRSGPGAVCDAQGRPLGFALIPGRASELRAAPELLLLITRLGTLRCLVCDAAYASAAWFAPVMEADARWWSAQTHPVVPKTLATVPPTAGDTGRDPVGQAEGVARPRPRYDKTAKSFGGTLYRAAAFQWLS
jgi:hypothetical protein